MANIHILREHTLGLAQARQLALAWTQQVSAEFGMECHNEPGAHEDCVSFSRSGVQGTLQVSATRFELDAKLGLLVSTFKNSIEHQIGHHLDTLLAARSVAKKAQSARPAARKTGKKIPPKEAAP